MKTHELARILLARPDVDLYIGFESADFVSSIATVEAGKAGAEFGDDGHDAIMLTYSKHSSSTMFDTDEVIIDVDQDAR
jgi:hypothetical protein